MWTQMLRPKHRPSARAEVLLCSVCAVPDGELFTWIWGGNEGQGAPHLRWHKGELSCQLGGVISHMGNVRALALCRPYTVVSKVPAVLRPYLRKMPAPEPQE